MDKTREELLLEQYQKFRGKVVAKGYSLEKSDKQRLVTAVAYPT